MKTLEQLNTAVKTMREHRAVADQAEAEINTKLGRIPQEGYTAEYKAKKAKEIVDAYSPAIANALKQTMELNAEIAPAAPFWESTSYVLSNRPVTPSAGNHPFAPAADANAEAVARLSKMQEYSGMPDELLHLHADAAKATGKLGELHLINQENQKRAATSPNFKPLDLSGVVLPDQVQATNLFKEGKIIQTTLEHSFRAASGGRPVTAIERINLQRAQDQIKPEVSK